MDLKRRIRGLAAALCALAACAPAGAAGAGATGVPDGWPSTLQIGLRDEEGGAAALSDHTGVSVRYHYLSGGANTGRSWTTWALGGGSFVSGFIADSASHGFLPAFSLYHLRETRPAASMPEEAGILKVLRDRDAMRSYLQDVRLFMQKAGAEQSPVVLHVEPDVWGYIERHATANDASSVPAKVAATGLSELAGLPDTAAGFAQAFATLRDRYAPKVMLGYHLSDWGAGDDVAINDPSDARIDELAARAVAFERSLHTRFDLIFAEMGNRDAGYRERVEGNRDGWWDAADYTRSARLVGRISAGSGLRVVLWQIPLGNSRLPDTRFHYRDNRVERLLGTSSDAAALRARYVEAGAIGLLFGNALDGTTSTTDQDRDGRADDDGVFFSMAGSLGTLPALPGATKRPRSTVVTHKHAVRMRIAVRRVTRSVRRTKAIGLNVRVTSAKTTRALIAVQIYAPGATRPTAQVALRDQRLRRGIPRRHRVHFTISADAIRGHWRVKVGVFDPDWEHLLAWREHAADFAVR